MRQSLNQYCKSDSKPIYQLSNQKIIQLMSQEINSLIHQLMNLLVNLFFKYNHQQINRQLNDF